MPANPWVEQLRSIVPSYNYTPQEQAVRIPDVNIPDPTEAADRYMTGTGGDKYSALLPLLLSRRNAAGSSQGVSSPVSPNTGGIPTGGVSRGSSKDFNAFLSSIAKQESGGNYGAVNRSSGALGKYQIMPANIASWSKSALGHSISPQQFLKSPQLQEAVAQAKLRQYYNKYGASGAAQAWYGGPGSVGKNVSGGKGYPSSNQYAAAIRRRMGG